MRSWRQFGSVASLVVMGVACVAASGQTRTASALRRAVGSGGAGVVLEVSSGKVLASVGDVSAARYAPGSTLKPFVLLAALEDGVVREGTVVPCSGTLTVAGRNLACTHPAELRSFTAETALAYSCNAYFAAVARRMRPEKLLAALDLYGVHASAKEPALQDPGARVLLALGLAGVAVRVEQLAEAYRRLALKIGSAQDGSGRNAVGGRGLDVVRRGLEGSVRYGMANGAATAAVVLAGKTGTASEPRQTWTHGWFAGIVYGEDGAPRQVVVMFVPRGSGADAAVMAHRYLALLGAK